MLDALGLQPVLHGDMALGEGTGAVMLLPLLDMALRVYHGAHTFDALNMAAYTPQRIKNDRAGHRRQRKREIRVGGAPCP